MQGKSVVIIGAGVVGAAIADELSAKGWPDITVVDQGQLPKPGGSSSHAPGMVFQHHASPVMSEFAQHTVRKFSKLDHNGEAGFDVVGGLEIAMTPERLADFRRRHGWAQTQSLETEIIGPDECKRLHPLLDSANIAGGLYCPNDGVARAVVAVNAQLSSAQSRGVRIIENCTVTGIRTVRSQLGDKVTGIDTDRGPIDADVLVCCAGIWGPLLADMVGDQLPMTVVEHQVATTSKLDEFANHTAEATTPIIRHLDAGLYYRDRFDRLEIGSFAHRPIPVAPQDILSPRTAPVMPSMHPFTPEDFRPQWESSTNLMSALDGATVEEGYNGLMAFTQDDFPLLGPSPRVEGMWYAEAVWVTQSAGVGLAMAEWLTDGWSSSFDLSPCELSRFDGPLTSPYLHQHRDLVRYAEIYDIAHPQDSWKDLRNIRTSPFYDRECELGAVFSEFNGWERPLWYESNTPPVSPAQAGRRQGSPSATNAAGTNYSGWTAQNWSPAVGAEARAARTTAALVDLTSLIRISIRGRDAQQLLSRVSTAPMPRPLGSVVYTLMLDEGGKVRSDITITCLGEDEFLLGGNSPRDLAWLQRNAKGMDVIVQDITPGTACIGLWGPESFNILQALQTTGDILPLDYFQSARGHIMGVPVICQRVSYIGEFGWEIITTADTAQHLWDILYQYGAPLGLTPIGRSAVDSLRLEAGFRSYGTDVTSEHTAAEAGLSFALSSRSDYLGADRARTVAQKLITLTHNNGAARLLGGEPVMAKNTDNDFTTVGRIASAAHSYTTGQPIATAWVSPEHADIGARLTIAAFDTDRAATVIKNRLIPSRINSHTPAAF